MSDDAGKRPPADELGAHVSSAGGVHNAPGRAAELDARVLQLFTKQPNRWAEREFDDDVVAAFRAARAEHAIRVAGSHDSYLINLASTDETLWERSCESFRMELARCASLGLEFLVTHPGNATGGDPEEGMRRNAEGIRRALDDVAGPTRVLLEGTAGTGTSLGSTFEELARIIDLLPAEAEGRVGVCLDTCHLWAAGYDIVDDWDGVVERLDATVGVERVGLFHLNDSKTPFDSRRDRHAHIGAGSIGLEGFRNVLADDRFADVPKLLETPKDDDAVAADRANLARLRGMRG